MFFILKTYMTNTLQNFISYFKKLFEVIIAYIKPKSIQKIQK